MNAGPAPVSVRTGRLPEKYLLFLGDVTERYFAKTAFGLRDWAPQRCVGEVGVEGCTVSTGLPGLTPAEAFAKGARALVVGVAPVGGIIKPSWVPTLVYALECGLDVVSGMHTRLASLPHLAEVAVRFGRELIDVREPPASLPIATGLKRSGRRLLTVGTDCAVGKKYSALAIAAALRRRGVDADFRATGQTGILIAGGGIPIDSVVADFIAGAAEMLSPDAAPAHWDVIEGQGSVFHPAYSGVSLGLLHGSQPDVLVVCHAADRRAVLGFPSYSAPKLAEAIELHLTLARRVNPAVRCAGVSINTSALSHEAALPYLAQVAADLELPAADPMRAGPAFDALIESCLAA